MTHTQMRSSRGGSQRGTKNEKKEKGGGEEIGGERRRQRGVSAQVYTDGVNRHTVVVVLTRKPKMSADFEPPQKIVFYIRTYASSWPTHA